jgi:L-fuconolactonase
MSAGWIDAHQHVWDLSGRDQPWLDEPANRPLRRSFGLTELAPQAAAAGVTSTVLVQALASAAETQELLELAAREPLVAGVVGWIDMGRPGVRDRIAALQAGPGGDLLVGVRHLVQSEPDPDWLTRPAVLKGLREIGSAGLSYDLLTLPAQLPAARRAASSVPELRFVLDHLSKPEIRRQRWQPWADEIAALASYPNVACKLSGLVTQVDQSTWSVAELRPYAEHALDTFGPDRVMFGSDWPVCTLAASYAEVAEVALTLTSRLSATERSDVFAGAAARAYRLPSSSTRTARPADHGDDRTDRRTG